MNTGPMIVDPYAQWQRWTGDLYRTGFAIALLIQSLDRYSLL